MGVSPFLCGWTDRTPWKGMLSGPNSRPAAAQTADFCKTTQISAAQESAPLLQKQSQTASPSTAGASSEK